MGSSRITKQLSEMYKFTSFQYSVVIGLLLSDGWTIYASGASKNPRLGFKQSLSHSAYFWSVFSILSPYCSSTPNFISSKRKQTNVYALEILTRSLPCFTKLYSLYYPNGVKIVPADIYNLLTPIALAHWIQGDGAKKNKGITLCTDNFTIQEVVLLMNILLIKFYIKSTIHKEKNYYRIYINNSELSKIIPYIKPYFVNSFLYKIS